MCAKSIVVVRTVHVVLLVVVVGTKEGRKQASWTHSSSLKVWHPSRDRTRNACGGLCQCVALCVCVWCVCARENVANYMIFLFNIFFNILRVNFCVPKNVPGQEEVKMPARMLRRRLWANVVAPSQLVLAHLLCSFCLPPSPCLSLPPLSLFLALLSWPACDFELAANF